MEPDVFPARAGMSPAALSRRVGEEGVPRASGDEPAQGAGGVPSVMCSPRERG